MSKKIGCLKVFVGLAVGGVVLRIVQGPTPEERRRAGMTPSQRASEDSAIAANWKAAAKRKAVVGAAKAKVLSRLKDPESAKFSAIYAAGDSSLVACGHVNAKNSFGGYSGDELFAANELYVIMESDLKTMSAKARHGALAILAVCDTLRK